MIYLDGAYRVHEPEDVVHFTQLAVSAFPDFAGRIDCFGADWLGRQFATDRHRLIGGVPQVLMLEPGTGEALEIPVGQADFHTQELIEEPDAAVAEAFFKQWLMVGGRRPEYGQCVGYRKPLYLGGADEVTNLELIDFDVYWTMAAQLLRQVRGRPIGTAIGNVSISD
jgi:hypothetical protein